ncbi:unnamed protein product [Schistocephalus solidus]|uniref:Uncharacterized protein n=1 Tax=Schistocephalus solidus TaxID=70667 RepID=A0A183T0M3_SCHSO|nr:unnamed protein product [Schistocephalus solidus]
MLVITSSAAGRGSQIANYAVVKLNKQQYPPSPSPRHTLQAAREQTAGMEEGASRSGSGALQVNIAPLSLTRFSEQGQLEEVVADYTFF